MSGQITWWSQPFPPEGGQTAEGIKRQLGRPSLPEYAVLVREAVQNSWDARLSGSIDFSIDLRKLGNDALAWRKWLGEDAGPTADSGRRKLFGLHSGSWILTLSDRRTSGLGGPLRSDEAEVRGQVANFIQFIRNVGEPRDQHLGGGTYGFGKGIFFRISEAGAILVDTLNTDGDAHSRRLMGSALGGIEIDSMGRRYTGRHWWGEINDNVPDPVMGERAERIARELGLPGFADGRTGTDVTVILPNFELDEVDGDVALLAEKLRAHIYWNLWPKMGSTARSVDINFSISIDGRILSFPTTDEVPVIREFAAAIDDVRKHRGTAYYLQKYRKDLGFLGHLSLQHTMPELTGDSRVWTSITGLAPISPPYRHIARMRQAELVVDYFEGEPMPTPQIGYVGAFVATESADEYFAQSEPPTHDAWEPGASVGAARGIVQGAKIFLRDECRKQVEARTGARSKTVEGLGRLATTLGALVQEASGTRATLKQSGRGAQSGGGGGSKRRLLRTLSDSRIVLVQGMPYVETRIEVGDGLRDGTIIRAELNVILAGGRRENPDQAPVGWVRPRVIGWFREGADSPSATSESLAVPELEPGTWIVRAEALTDVSVRLVVIEEQ